MRIASLLLLLSPLLGSSHLVHHEAPSDLDRRSTDVAGLEPRSSDASAALYFTPRHLSDRRERQKLLQRRQFGFTSTFKPSFNPPAQGFVRPSRWQPANKKILDINKLSWTNKAEKWTNKNDPANKLKAEQAAVDGLHHLEGQGKEHPKADSMVR